MAPLPFKQSPAMILVCTQSSVRLPRPPVRYARPLPLLLFFKMADHTLLHLFCGAFAHGAHAVHCCCTPFLVSGATNISGT